MLKNKQEDEHLLEEVINEDFNISCSTKNIKLKRNKSKKNSLKFKDRNNKKTIDN